MRCQATHGFDKCKTPGDPSGDFQKSVFCSRFREDFSSVLLNNNWSIMNLSARFSLRLIAVFAVVWMIVVTRDPLHGQEKAIDFQRDIQPIFAEHCFHCHGQDDSARQSGLRLDVRDAVLKGGDSGEATIIPGRAADSGLMTRIRSTDADLVMPPPKEKKQLTDAQKRLIQTWIDQGAPYAAHWAFVPPRSPQLPQVGHEHPIDRLVNSKLQSLGLKQNAPAASENLCRRLYLDLIGLPPSPQEIRDFAQHGFLPTVDKLLDSERYGEKWARHWLDVARYSDTNGYEKDMRREQWIWRDWVIAALNRDLPYDQFLIEQLAGDLLPGATQEQKIATGFLRNSMLNEEGAIVPEQFRMFEMFDRMDCVGKSVLGLTIQCAQCHAHKFDPLSQQEYYGMFAFLNDSHEALSSVYSAAQQQKIGDIQSRIRTLEEQLKRDHSNWREEIQKWRQSVINQQAQWIATDALELGSNSGLNHPVQLVDKSLLMLGHSSSDIYMVVAGDFAGITGLRIEALTHGDLPHRGPGRGAQGTWAVTEIDVLARQPAAKSWEKLKLASATADFSQPDDRQADGKKATGPAAYLIDGKEETVAIWLVHVELDRILR